MPSIFLRGGQAINLYEYVTIIGWLSAIYPTIPMHNQTHGILLALYAVMLHACQGERVRWCRKPPNYLLQ